MSKKIRWRVIVIYLIFVCLFLLPFTTFPFPQLLLTHFNFRLFLLPHLYHLIISILALSFFLSFFFVLYDVRLNVKTVGLPKFCCFFFWRCFLYAHSLYNKYFNVLLLHKIHCQKAWLGRGLVLSVLFPRCIVI